MGRPDRATFDRLRQLIAIDRHDTRPTRPVLEAFTGEEMTTIPVGTAEDLQLAVNRARAAQARWAERTPADRAAVISRFADLVFARRVELMDMAQAETGKARAYAQEEVVDVALTARHYAATGPKTLKAHRVKGMIPGATDVRVRYQPKADWTTATPHTGRYEYVWRPGWTGVSDTRKTFGYLGEVQHFAHRCLGKVTGGPEELVKLPIRFLSIICYAREEEG